MPPPTNVYQKPGFLIAYDASSMRSLESPGTGNGILLFVQGITDPYDGTGGFFFWNPYDTSDDDNLNTFASNWETIGRWNRLFAGSIPPVNPVIATGAITERYLQDRFAQELNVLDFGAVGDMTFVSSVGTATASSTTFTTQSALPVTAIGKHIVIAGAGTAGATHATTIANVSGTTVTLADAAGATTPTYVARAFTSVGAGGTGYVVGDTITLVSGTILTVRTVLAGVVTDAVVTTQVSLSAVPTQPEAQASTSGVGINFTGRVAYTGSGQFWYGTDDSVALQAALDAAGAINADVRLPVGKVCGISAVLTMPTADTFLIGSGHDKCGIVALASMTSVVRTGTVSVKGGGIRNCFIDAFKLAANATLFRAGRRMLMMNMEARNATTAEIAYGDGTTTLGDNTFLVCFGLTDISVFGPVAQLPTYNWFQGIGGTDGRIFGGGFSNALTANVWNARSGNQFSGCDIFGNAPYQATYGMDLGDTSGYGVVATDIQVGNAASAAIHISSNAVNVRGLFGQWNNSVPNSTTYAILIDSGANYINVSGVNCGNALAADNVIVQSGTPGVGVVIGGNSRASYSQGTTPITSIPPQGRLTLQTGVPVMTADQVDKSTVYYDSYAGNLVPVWNGTFFQFLTITSDQVSMGLDTTNVVSGSVYDVFAINNSGALAICVGPAWSTTASRGTGAGTTQLERILGIWTNKQSLTHAYGGASGTTDYGPISDNRGTYLGSIYATANGQTTFKAAPNSATGGAAEMVGIFNAWNQVTVTPTSKDTTASWAGVSSGNWEMLDPAAVGSGANNSVTALDGLGINPIDATLSVPVLNTSSAVPMTGITIDSQSATPFEGSASAATAKTTQFAHTAGLPALGLRYVQAMQQAANTTAGVFTTQAVLTLHNWRY